jgi:hypothetical protein
MTEPKRTLLDAAMALHGDETPASGRGGHNATNGTPQDHPLEGRVEIKTDAREWQTWRDWLPNDAPEEIRNPDQLVTREEIAARLDAIGVTATPDDLRYWEKTGILPRGVRQRHLGATRSVYPTWYVFLAWGLREFQAEGVSLKQASQRLRELFDEALREGNGNPSPIADMIAVDSVYRGVKAAWHRWERLKGRDVAGIEAGVIIRYPDDPIGEFVRVVVREKPASATSESSQ